MRFHWRSSSTPLWLFAVGLALVLLVVTATQGQATVTERLANLLGFRQDVADNNSAKLVSQGRETFRFDTFGDESFWGDTLKLHQAIEGSKFGGVGPGVSPKTALAVGLKVDVDALPSSLVTALKASQVNLDDPATTLALLKLNAVVGVQGGFNSDGSIKTVGITCAICHSTVDDSLTHGIGHRLDGWANHDLNVGAIVSLAPNLQPVADYFGGGTTVSDVKKILAAWGPGKFDAELFLDGKGFRPDGQTAASMIPNAFGLAGQNLHTWGGGWGTVAYWNAFVANLEMHGPGNFFDPRLDDATKYPLAAAHNLGHIQVDPARDRITSKLAALQFYQLSLPSPQPRPNVDYDPAAAQRGKILFDGVAKCSSCHTESLYTEPGWNDHKASEIGIDDFQANRAPANAYRTANLGGLFVQEEGLFMDPANKGRFYHDGRFATMLDVVNHYDSFFTLGLTAQQKSDIVEYLKSLSSP